MRQRNRAVNRSMPMADQTTSDPENDAQPAPDRTRLADTVQYVVAAAVMIGGVIAGAMAADGAQGADWPARVTRGDSRYFDVVTLAVLGLLTFGALRLHLLSAIATGPCAITNRNTGLIHASLQIYISSSFIHSNSFIH